MLPPFIVEHVRTALRVIIWDTLVTIRTVILSLGDTFTDVYATAHLLARASAFATPMLVALVFAQVAQAVVTKNVQRETAVATTAAWGLSRCAH